MIGDSDIYYIYRVWPTPDGSERRLLGKIVLFGSQIRVLEDHDGFLGQIFPQTTNSLEVKKTLTHLSVSPYFDVESDRALEEGQGHVPDLEFGPEDWPMDHDGE